MMMTSLDADDSSSSLSDHYSNHYPHDNDEDEELAVHHHDDDDDDVLMDDESLASLQKFTTAAAQRRRLSTSVRVQSMVIARGENRAVFFLKITVVSLLIGVAIVASTLTHEHLRKNEIDLFHNQWNDLGTKIIQAFRRSTTAKLSTANTMSVAYTSFVTSSSTTWPNVSLPDVEIRFAGIRQLSNATFLTFSPLLENDLQRFQWQDYATEWNEQQENNNKTTPTTRLSNFLGREGTNYSRHDCHIQSAMMMTNQTPCSTQGWNISDGIFSLDGEGNPQKQEFGNAPYVPIWQTIGPAGEYNRNGVAANNTNVVMYNQMSERERRHALNHTITTGGISFSKILNDEPLRSALFYPIFQSLELFRGPIVGIIGVEYDWTSYFQEDFASDSFNDIDIVLENTCGQELTFTIQNQDLVLVGWGDLHDNRYDDLVQTFTTREFHALNDGLGPQLVLDDNDFNRTCHYAIRVYPSDAFRLRYITNEPIHFAIGMAAIFGFATLLFMLYDFLVERRQSRTLETAARSSAVVNSLFPATVRDRVYGQKKEKEELKARRRRRNNNGGQVCSPSSKPERRARNKMTIFSRIGDSAFLSMPSENATTPPIADLFPATTVMFADIAGFTAWSSEREPKDVFALLESLYRSFDSLANKLGVFKVETIGDCYVAVAGLPEPNKDHAVIMSRFAHECLEAMNHLSKQLESSLGPGTGDLALRVGLHSGPVTGGVLRGEKSRFQLFGDTINTASRMESNSMRNMIQVSATTADLLVASGKQHWLTARKELVQVKGKGNMQTYWLKPMRRKTSLPSNSGNSNTTNELTTLSNKIDCSARSNMSNPWGELTTENNDNLSSKHEERLVEWNVEVLATALSRIVSQRQDLTDNSIRGRRRRRSTIVTSFALEQDRKPIDEVAEAIKFPTFDARSQRLRRAPSCDVLSDEVRDSLQDYVTRIASLYREVPFHNFTHASHVTLSANKLINRIVDAARVDSSKDAASERHRFTYGISSDPIAQFSILLAALIHDVDHTGLPNAQLIKEDNHLATKYEGKSVAEQNSVDIAWDILMEPRYGKLRSSIYANEIERKRFRQLIVNAVMATDIMDKDMLTMRKNKWEKAFHRRSSSSFEDKQDLDDDMNRKATIVIEHVIQASDIAHTMQHWHIYCKWNERLFQEQYKAYVSGHNDRNPAVGWYEGEIWFFDNYIIPLAKKLRECGVFGVSSDEYLGFALANRTEWEHKGRLKSEEMTYRAQEMYGLPQPVANIRPSKAA